MLISTGVWRPKPRYLPSQPPSSKPLISLLLPLSLSPCLWRLPPSYRLRRQVCEGCRCQLSFSWTTANLSLYLPSVVISSFIPIALFFPTPCHLSVNELCAWSRPLFSSLDSMFLRRGQGVTEPSSAHWHNGTKVGQGGEHPGWQTVCGPRTMPALQSVSSVLSAKQTLHFPFGLAASAFFSGLLKVRRA